jgi:2-polyprenyl-3-methyl-5-hydroxy-6-metoxy-1,4-benzoquinol methylase
MTNPPSSSVDPALLRESMARWLYGRSVVTGQITLPAVPSMIDEYVTMCANVFAGVGRSFTAEQLVHVKTVLEGQLAVAYSASQCSKVVISFDALGSMNLNYRVKVESRTLDGVYEKWIEREPPLFGSQPDARVWALANDAADPRTHRVLDIGAGTGRNALALARRGHPVDAVEMTPNFAEVIRLDAGREQLDVRVIQRDIFLTTADLGQDYQLILLSEVVSDFRTTQQLRGIFELAAHCLARGGRLVFNAFVARQGYTPDNAARELGPQCYTSIFTRDEISTAASELPLELIADDSVYEYEKAHLPEGAWPPTNWYANWACGLAVFDVEPEKSPIECRWLVYQKRG